jgi:hypothetical protein
MSSDSETWWFYSVDEKVPVEKESSGDYKQFKDIIANDPQKWVPFDINDNERLEAAYESKKVSQVTVKQDSLFQVDFETMKIEPIYWTGPSYSVRR